MSDHDWVWISSGCGGRGYRCSKCGKLRLEAECEPPAPPCEGMSTKEILYAILTHMRAKWPLP